MAENSNIEWTHHTFNPWRGCTKVSAGCKHCYADTMSKRNPATLGVWGKHGSRVAAAESYWQQPAKWDAAARKAGERHRVFCASLADVFEGFGSMPDEAAPVVMAARERLWNVIEATPHLDWLLLTKRPENVKWFAPSGWLMDGFPPNVWIGTSVENQAAADERIPHLLTVPARVRFLSCEPLLGPVDLRVGGSANNRAGMYIDCLTCNGTGYRKAMGYEHGGFDTKCAGCKGARRIAGVHWVIVGGESGSNARPMQADWARELRYQCGEAGVAFLFKQHGGVRDKRGGDAAILDGRLWHEFPEVR